MSVQKLSLLGAMALHMTRESHPDLPVQIYKLAHNANANHKGNVSRITHLVSVEKDGLSVSSHLITDGKSSVLSISISTSAWDMSGDQLALKCIPNSWRNTFDKPIGSTLGQAGIISSDPWKDMVFTAFDRSSGEDDEYDEEGPKFTLEIPELSRTVGILSCDGVKTWTEKWM